jgi:hypothetical protein
MMQKRMTRIAGKIVVLLVCACAPTAGNAGDLSFVQISQQGFDMEDNRRDLNDYPWSMTYFAPGNATGGHVYVGTGNSMMNLIMARLGVKVSVSPLKRPPEIRRYRPDLGEMVWERVFDYRDVEQDPQWESSGIRAMAAYSAADGVSYLYAGTLGTNPAVWRSDSGDPGSWVQVLSIDLEGSIRALAVHRGLLYIAVTHEFLDPAPPAELYVTDGNTVALLNDDGFGNPANTGIFSLASYNGWLYAGTSNRDEGFEVWKLAGPGINDAPEQVVSAGGPFKGNQAAGSMKVFKERLYVGALIFAGINTSGGFPLRGADMIRIDADDSWETVVGPDAAGNTGSGFNTITNAYLWSLEEYGGRLYCGTWDAASFVPVTQKYLPDIRRTILDFLLGVPRTAGAPTPYDRITGNGAELYVSDDGRVWEPVFTDGLGNPDNYGVRQMLAVDERLYLGLANIDEGLSIWRSD